MRTGIVVFPGSNCDMDALYAMREVLGQPAEYVWHGERDLTGFDAIILPGGFSYGDYLRTGAIAQFSRVMEAVGEFAEQGRLVLGICNGFQILCEAGLLPGALQRNNHLEFRCVWSHLRVENANTPFTGRCREGQVLKVPVSHGEGNYFADADTLAGLNANQQVLFRYCDAQGNVTPESCPNGSLENIAGIMNKRGNVMGLMPHPERAVETMLGSADGRFILESAMEYLAAGTGLLAR